MMPSDRASGASRSAPQTGGPQRPVALVVGAAFVLLALASVRHGPVRGAPTAAPEAARLLIDPNTATPAELELLPGVGPVLAARIVRFRETAAARPAFARLEDLDAVPRIGPTTLERLRPFLRFGAPPAKPTLPVDARP